MENTIYALIKQRDNLKQEKETVDQFISSLAFEKIDDDNQDLLLQQQAVMESFLEILTARINLNKRRTSSPQ